MELRFMVVRSRKQVLDDVISWLKRDWPGKQPPRGFINMADNTKTDDAIKFKSIRLDIDIDSQRLGFTDQQIKQTAYIDISIWDARGEASARAHIISNIISHIGRTSLYYRIVVNQSRRKYKDAGLKEVEITIPIELYYRDDY